MKILGIETSCDETALAIIEGKGDFSRPGRSTSYNRLEFRVLVEALNSQTKIHEKYGGVFPMMAKREHAKNLIPLLKELLTSVDGAHPPLPLLSQNQSVEDGLPHILEREPELLEQFLEFIPTISKPDIDAIAVTTGPGLEPALWVGINFAKALGLVWNLPVIAVNHMEGHIVSALLTQSEKTQFPILALLISGGHTQLVLIKKWQEYEILGETRDDAVGEAFDKVARMMGLPYPGGPEISRLAESTRTKGPRQTSTTFRLPRPMLHSDNYDFSFSGLKTAVLYTIKKMTESEKSSPDWKAELAREFEDSITEVLISKTKRAIEEFGIQTLIVSGGVSANNHLRQSFQKLVEEFPSVSLLIPAHTLATDNAVMIAAAGYFNSLSSKQSIGNLEAKGNLSLV